MPLLETPGHSRASLGQPLVGSLLLSSQSWGTRFCLCPPSLFSQSCVSSGSTMVGLMATSSKRTYATPKVCCTQSLCPCGWPLLTQTSAGDTQTLKGRSDSVFVGSSGVHKVLFKSFERLWWVWGLILNAISPLLPPCPWAWGIFIWWDPTFFCRWLFSRTMQKRSS